MNTLVLEMNNGKTPIGQSRKKSPIEMGDFAQMLNFQETRPSGPRSFPVLNDHGESKMNSEESSLHLRSEKPKESSPQDKNKPSASSQEADEPRSRESRDAKETEEEGLSRASESGPTRQADSEKGVDGCENGVQPGSGTEATVNAQSQAGEKLVQVQSEQSGLTPESSGTQPTAASAQEQSQELEQLVQQLAAAANMKPEPTGKANEGALSAKTIEKKNPVMPVNLNLTDQKIIFETGLAQHFVRVLTDQYEQLKTQARQKSDGTGPDPALQPLTQNGDSANTAKTLNSVTSSPPQLNLTGDNATEGMNRILQIIRSNIGRRQSQITMQLDPPELGKLRMDVKLIDNNLSLAITTETNEARQVLTNRMETLRTNLEQSGITISKFEISTKAPDSPQNQNWQQDQQSGNHGQSFAQHQQQGSNSFHQASNNDTYFESDNKTETNQVTVPVIQSPDKALNMVA